ncbi:MAG: hypothetical protein QY323_01015 [Patescibacteria group bacterium]|nr:MAG: hypothetical protein QY323_01015 [Patescibacteria group bacterium]
MTFRQYLFWMGLSTALCWLGVFSIISIVDPLEGGILGVLLLYAALSLALIGTFSVLGMVVRAGLRRQEAVSRHVAVSFRQSLLLTLLVVGALILQSRTLLTWWNLLLFAATLTVLEFFLISFRSGR